MGGRCPRSPECCPRWIGITVRNQSESLSAIAGIRNVLRANQRDGYALLMKAAAESIIEIARD